MVNRGDFEFTPCIPNKVAWMSQPYQTHLYQSATIAILGKYGKWSRP